MRMHYMVCIPRDGEPGMADIVAEGYGSETVCGIQSEAWPGSYVLTNQDTIANEVEWEIDWRGIVPVPVRRAVPKVVNVPKNGPTRHTITGKVIGGPPLGRGNLPD